MLIVSVFIYQMSYYRAVCSERRHAGRRLSNTAFFYFEAKSADEAMKLAETMCPLAVQTDVVVSATLPSICSFDQVRAMLLSANAFCVGMAPAACSHIEAALAELKAMPMRQYAVTFATDASVPSKVLIMADAQAAVEGYVLSRTDWQARKEGMTITLVT